MDRGHHSHQDPHILHISHASSFAPGQSLCEKQFLHVALHSTVTLELFFCPFKTLDKAVTEGAWHLEAVTDTI